MNEAGFIRSVHRRLPPSVHAWKIAAQFANGVPDCWYSGMQGDLWVEYKFVQATPKRTISPRLSKLQVSWLEHRLKEGRNVAVIVGSPGGAAILHGLTSWSSVAVPPLVSTPDVAAFIQAQVEG